MTRAYSTLIVNPYVHDFKLYDEWMHPIGLYYLMHILSENGIDVHYFDCLERSSITLPKKYGTGPFISREIQRPGCYHDIKRKYKCYGCSEEAFLRFLMSLPNIDIIFIGSMMTYWVYGILETIRVIKMVYPDTPILCGGIAVQLIPGFFKKQIIPNVKFYSGNLLTDTPTIILPGLPAPLQIPKQYSMVSALPFVFPVNHGPLLLSLGCPLRCSYCASPFLQPVRRQRTLEVVIQELFLLNEKYGIRDFAFYDDALLMDTEALFIPFLEQIIHRNINVRFHTPNGLHLRAITKPLLELMKAAGFKTLRFGYESSAFKHRYFTGGKVTLAVLEEKMQLLREFNFQDTGIYVMGGLPGSTPDEMAEEMNFIANFGIKVKPVFLSPVPGTELFQTYVSSFPALATDPLWHNDTFFITRLESWGGTAVETIRKLSHELALQLSKR